MTSRYLTLEKRSRAQATADRRVTMLQEQAARARQAPKAAEGVS